MPLDPTPAPDRGTVTLTYNVGTHELNATVHHHLAIERSEPEYWMPHFATCPNKARVGVGKG